jgi:hypothetical protein
VAQFATKCAAGHVFRTGGVFFWDETVFSRDENVLKQWASYPCLQRSGVGQNAILIRSDLDAVMQQIPRLNGPAGGSIMIEASAALLAVLILAIFAADALDAYRTG